VAGWYGPEFDGREMADGDTFDMNAPTAAHLTLPLGSLVRVIDLRTRISQIVRITDRGPYVDGRGLDVSYGVARKLGFDLRGLARVRMELLEVPKRHLGIAPAN
jgi:rare lipoprotein A